jgi:hypothetical protein
VIEKFWALRNYLRALMTLSKKTVSISISMSTVHHLCRGTFLPGCTSYCAQWNFVIKKAPLGSSLAKEEPKAPDRAR